MSQVFNKPQLLITSSGVFGTIANTLMAAGLRAGTMEDIVERAIKKASRGNKYTPHDGEQAKARRRRQMEKRRSK